MTELARTVLFEGSTDPRYWGRLAELAQSARVVSYSRAALGAGTDWSLAAMAHRLHDTARELDVPRPFVLTGHSFTGLLAQYYACVYPEDIAGLVLLDPTPHALKDPPGRAAELIGTAFTGSLLAASRLGLFRTRVGSSLARRFAAASARPGADALQLQGMAVEMADPASWVTLQQIMKNLLKYGEEITARLERDPLPDVPMTVVSAAHREAFGSGKKQASRPVYEELRKHHEWLATLVPDGRFVLAEDSGHQIPCDQPELVIDIVRDVIARASLKAQLGASPA